MTKYQSIQFAPDGDYITDYHEPTIGDVWERVNDQGSKWFFYPFPFVITDGETRGAPGKRIVSCPDGLEHFQGRTIATVVRELRSNPGYYHALLT